MEEKRIYSIGYGNMQIDDFIQPLKKFNIQVLIDVRLKPKSNWNTDYNKDTLKEHLYTEGIEYKWYKDLHGYTTNKDVHYFAKIKRIISISESQNVVMMCSELDPGKCHRYKKITPDIETKKKVYHIYRNEIHDPVIQEETKPKKKNNHQLPLMLF